MNFFQYHIGDFAAATSHLSLVEKAIYMSLLVAYYRDEKPLPTDPRQLEWLAGVRTKKECEFLRRILAWYFVLEEDGWHNSRADEEIKKFHKHVTTAQENGKRGGRPKKDTPPSQEDASDNTEPDSFFPLGVRSNVSPEPTPSDDEPCRKPNPFETETQTKPNNNPTETQTKANQYPIPNNQYPFQINLKGGVGENMSMPEPLSADEPIPSASPPDAAPQSGSLPLPEFAKAEAPMVEDDVLPEAIPASPSVDAEKAGRQEENTPEHGRNGKQHPLGRPLERLCGPTGATEGPSDTRGAGGVETPLTAAPAAISDDAAEAVVSPEGEPAKAKKCRTREKCTLNTALDEFHRDNPDGRFIAEDDPILRWAGSIGLPEEFLVLAWREFERRFLDSRKLQKDWRAHFRNACRQNWFKLWYATPDGEFKLSTVGIQLDRELDAQAKHEMPVIAPPSPQIAFEVPTPPPALDTAAGEMVAQLFSTTSTSFSAEKWSSP